MKENKNILHPVQREDFQLHFGGKPDAPVSPDDYFSATIEQYKKLAVGPYLWFIADAAKGMAHNAGGMVETLIPIKAGDMINKPADVIFQFTHADDLVQMFAFTHYWVSFFMSLPAERKSHVRATIYLRMLSPQKLYKWTMVQFVDTLTNSNGEILYALTLMTNISHIKKEGPAMMSIMDTYDDTDCRSYRPPLCTLASASANECTCNFS